MVGEAASWHRLRVDWERAGVTEVSVVVDGTSGGTASL